jgi:predicted transglutaminase-like protease
MVLDNTVDKELVKVEMTLLINLLDTIKQTKKDLNMSGWIHMPKYSEENVYYRLMCGNYEAFAHVQIGMMLWGESSEENMKTMIMHFKKAVLYII